MKYWTLLVALPNKKDGRLQTQQFTTQERAESQYNFYEQQGATRLELWQSERLK